MDNPQFQLTKSNLPTASSISLESLSRLSSLYPRVLLASPQQRRHHISPAELSRLDTLRYSTIPQTVSSRQSEAGEQLGGFVAKAELQDLLDWKLARGVFRPTLPSLIASNQPDTVIENTKKAFQDYTAPDPGSKEASVQNVLKTLCDLRGVGPATASLLLAVAHPTEVPFFSDELFYWAAATSDGVKLEKIKYNVKEYKQIVQAVTEVQDRLQREGSKGTEMGQRPRADDIERAAYVVQKLQNPDVWETVFSGGGEAAEAFVQNAKAKDRTESKREKQDRQTGEEAQTRGDANGKGGKTNDNELSATGSGTRTAQEGVAGLDEASPPTDSRTDLDEKEKAEVNEEKKEILVQHGAKVKSTGKKRARDPEDLPPPRRSARTRR